MQAATAIAPQAAHRAYFASTIDAFLSSSPEACLGQLVAHHSMVFGAVETTTLNSWQTQIAVLQAQLAPVAGLCQRVFFEFIIPRIGRRVDVVVLLHHQVLLLEFKVGETEFKRAAIEQAWDYALDLRHFHETSRGLPITPAVVATAAPAQPWQLGTPNDGVRSPVCIHTAHIGELVRQLAQYPNTMPAPIDPEQWERGRYQPSPSILEAALALYRGHKVEEISRSDAEGIALATTTQALRSIIADTQRQQHKAICFVTGVPGAGKTLVRLNLTNHTSDAMQPVSSVYLSGNGPLVAILREALAEDQLARQGGNKKAALQSVGARIQNVHHYRDECLRDAQPPSEHVAVFDEAQRAWNVAQTSRFMREKKGLKEFAQSEPEYLISCLDRHRDWAVVVCLVGGGQEINTGEAGIMEWLRAVEQSFPDWHVHVTPQLGNPAYGGDALPSVLTQLGPRAHLQADLHLATSMRSFRATEVSAWVHAVLNCELNTARELLPRFLDRFPIVITRDLQRAKDWLRQQAQGSQRFGLLASSNAQRLKPLGIHIKSPIDPVHWFLKDKDDVRASFALEDAATEFQVQGLELDWCGVVWDADLRYDQGIWSHHAFRGTKWQRIKQTDDQRYLLNAYRVLLTRARLGMVMVVPIGEERDGTRSPAVYDAVYAYFRAIGVPSLT